MRRLWEESVTSMGTIAEQKKEVKKHVATIHCSSTLGLLQRKISNALLYHAYHELSHKAEHEITIKQLCNIIGYNGNNHAVIKEALKGLISIIIEWNVVDDKTGEEDWTASAILACANIKGSKCTYAYSPRMKSLLYSPSMYGKINLIVQARFKSSYGLALYENCVRFKGLPTTKWFELAMFRRLMGVPEDTYPIFRDFKKRVLDKSIEEVNTYSDLIVTVEINRVGRKVVGIRFKLKEREKKKKLGANFLEEGGVDGIDDHVKSAPLVTILKDKYSLSMPQIKLLFDLYQEDFISAKIKVVESSASYLSGKIENLSAYLLSALKEDYQPAKSSNEILYESRKVKDQQELEKNQQLQNEVLHKRQYDEYLTNKIDETIALLDQATFEKFKIQFELVLQDNLLVKRKFLKNGLEDKVVKIFFRKFLLETYPEKMPAMVSFHEYMQTMETC